MQLHQINKLNYSESVEHSWLQSIQQGDKILLIEEAILRTSIQKNTLKSLVEKKSTEIYYLQSDAKAYGISPDIGTALTDEQWVNITLSSDATISW